MDLGLLLLAASLSSAEPEPKPASAPDAARRTGIAERCAPGGIGAEVSRRRAYERQALARIVEAARIMDPLFLRQVWAGNESLLLELLEDQSPLGRARLRYFLINKGPWSRLDEETALLPGVPAKPHSADYYPAGATKAGVY